MAQKGGLGSSEGLPKPVFGGGCWLSAEITSGGLGESTEMWLFLVAWVSSQYGSWFIREEWGEKERKKGGFERQRQGEPRSVLPFITFRSHTVLFPRHFVP